MKNVIRKIFDDVPLFSVKGLNGEEEILDCIYADYEYIKNNLHERIKKEDLPDWDLLVRDFTKIMAKFGKTYVNNGYMDSEDIFLTRLYTHTRNRVSFSKGLDEKNFKDSTISASITCITDSPYKFHESLSFTKEDARLDPYSNFVSRENLPKLKQKLRKKVIAHELGHSLRIVLPNSPQSEDLGAERNLSIFEEYLVEKLALEALDQKEIYHVTNRDDNTLKYYGPNIDSSNGPSFFCGEVLCSILGEKNLQIARMKGRKYFKNYLCNELNLTYEELDMYALAVAGASDKYAGAEFCTRKFPDWDITLKYKESLNKKENVDETLRTMRLQTRVYAEAVSIILLTNKLKKEFRNKLDSNELKKEDIEDFYKRIYSPVVYMLKGNTYKTPAQERFTTLISDIDKRVLKTGLYNEDELEILKTNIRNEISNTKVVIKQAPIKQKMVS